MSSNCTHGASRRLVVRQILDRRVQSRPCCVESFRIGTPTDRDERGGYPEAGGGALGGCVWPDDQDLPHFKPVVTRSV